MSDSLKVTTFQSYLFWENIDKNLQNISLKLSSLREKTDLIILPEMFSTGFTLNVQNLAEDMGGKTIQWMKEQAEKFDCVIAGSLIIKEDGKYYNRLIWMRSDGTFSQYDKRHLFSLGREDEIFSSGKRRLLVNLKGWNICPVICYDLRFPVWLRNTNAAYDILIVIANWPEKRSHHWKALIPARAIENQSYVIAVNRFGYDGNEVYHSGDSMCLDPNGKTIYFKADDEDLYTFTILKEELIKTRRIFPFLKDADEFCINDQFLIK